MPRKHRQDIEGYNVAISHFEKEYKRALGATTRRKDIFQRALDQIQWMLDLLHQERREFVRTEAKLAPRRDGREKKAARPRTGVAA